MAGLLSSLKKAPPAAPAAPSTPAAPPPAAAAAPSAPPPAAARSIAISVKVGECKLGGKYKLPDGAEAEFTGTSLNIGFFQTATGSVKLATDAAVILVSEPAPLNTAPPLVVPPDAPAAAAPIHTPQPPGVPAPTSVAVAVAPPPATSAPAAPAAPEAPKRGRGRPPKSTTAAGATPAGDVLALYIGCSPLGTPTKTLSAYVDALDRDLCKAGGVAAFDEAGTTDVRTCEGGAYGFGKWKGYLAKLACENPPEPGHYVVSAGLDERIDVVVGALLSSADLVVMGGR